MHAYPRNCAQHAPAPSLGSPFSGPPHRALLPGLQAQMAERFLPVDLDTPGLRILSFDPPVFVLPGFFTGRWMVPRL